MNHVDTDSTVKTDDYGNIVSPTHEPLTLAACPEHRTYRGKRKPTAGCEYCRLVYEASMEGA